QVVLDGGNQRQLIHVFKIVVQRGAVVSGLIGYLADGNALNPIFRDDFLGRFNKVGQGSSLLTFLVAQLLLFHRTQHLSIARRSALSKSPSVFWIIFPSFAQ